MPPGPSTVVEVTDSTRGATGSVGPAGPAGPAGPMGSPGAPGSPGVGYANRALMAAIPAPTLFNLVTLGEPDHVGQFMVLPAASYAAAIAADTQQGLFVLSTTDASKVYMRIVPGDAYASWFNFKADDNGGASIDNLAVLNAAVATLRALRVTGGHVQQYGNGTSIGLCIVGAGYVSSKIIVDFGLRIYGMGQGNPGAAGTQLRFPLGTGGFLFTNTAAGWRLENMTLVGPWDITHDEGEFHGVEWHSTGTRRNLQIYYFQGDGLQGINSSGAGNNSNQDFSDRVFVQGCRNAIKTGGTDQNAGEHRGITGINNRQSCINEASDLGNAYYSPTAEGNGLYGGWTTGAANRPASYVLHNGKVWAAVGSQEVWCATHSPPAAGVQFNQGWVRNDFYPLTYAPGTMAAGGIPDWFNGITVRPGGGYLHRGDSNQSTFYGVYNEDGQINQFDVNCGKIEGQIPGISCIAVSSGGLSSVGGVLTRPNVESRSVQYGNYAFRGTFWSRGQTTQFGPADYFVGSTEPVADYNYNYYTSNYFTSLTFSGFAAGAGPYVQDAAIFFGLSRGYLDAKSEWHIRINSADRVIVSNSEMSPGNDNLFNLGSASFRYGTIYAGTGTINTSDERHKANISAPDDQLLDAWGEVEWATFQFKDAVETKGDDARIHTGLIAQQVKATFEKHGLDAFRYGLLCYDKWDDTYEQVFADQVQEERITLEDGTIQILKPVRSVPQMDKDGKPLLKLSKAAGELFGLRYTECQALENAWVRRELKALRG